MRVYLLNFLTLNKLCCQFILRHVVETLNLTDVSAGIGLNETELLD